MQSGWPVDYCTSNCIAMPRSLNHLGPLDMFPILMILIMSPLTDQRMVDTVQGKIRGEEHEGHVSYRGIPYASIQSTEERFKTAGLASTWQGVRDSRESDCHILATSVVDCLRLDVHVPTKVTGRRQQAWPVMVWIAGGGASYRPGKLVKQGIIVVIVYHRTGPFGFLCTNNESIPGNAGVKDVIIALRWVRDNIVAFKGNPSKVTVAGQGFGAAMVEGLMLSPMAEGLYQGIIMQSGSILCPWAFNHDSKERARAFIGMFKDDITKLKTGDLVSKVDKLNVTYFPFGMCVEKQFKKEARFLNDVPYKILIDKRVNAVPMIIGYNNEEGYIFASMVKETLKKIFEDIEVVLPFEIEFLNARELNQVVKLVEDIYFVQKNMSSLLKYYSDVYFISHIYRSIHLHLAYSRFPIYVYQFSHISEIGVREEPGVEKTGAAHSDELPYLFGDDLKLENDNERVQTDMVKLWTNFVKYLDPTPKEEPVDWEATSLENPRFLEITTEGLQMRNFPKSDTLKMWDEIYTKYEYYYNRIVDLEH